MKENSVDRRKILKTLGAASMGAVAASGAAGAKGSGENPYSDFASEDEFTSKPVSEVAFQIAENEKQNKIAFSAFTQESGMGIYLAQGVKDPSNVAKNVKQLSDAPYVYAPTWADNRTLRYFSGDGVYEQQVAGGEAGEAVETDLTMRDLISGDDVSTDGFSFSDCQYVSEVGKEFCVSSDAFSENLKRDCYCGPCSGGETPTVASAAFELTIYDGDYVDVDLGGWLGFNFMGWNACFWSGQEDTNVCAHTCVGATTVPAPEDVVDAFRPILEPNGVNADGPLGLAIVAVFVAAIVAFPGPTPV